MKYEVCDNSPQFYRARGVGKALVEFLRFSVNPRFRYYEDGAWYVHTSQVLDLTQLAYTTTGSVDWSALPDDLQQRITVAATGWCRVAAEKPIPPTLAYTTLYLTPSAPDFVIQAVWRVLAKKHHPDLGGDPEKFKEFKDAYDKVKG